MQSRYNYQLSQFYDGLSVILLFIIISQSERKTSLSGFLKKNLTMGRLKKIGKYNNKLETKL
jgi:hypothetical protein